jgi:hypothetical protein
MVNLGDRAVGSTLSFLFNTHKADGTPITLAGTPVISVYKNSVTQTTTGVTLTVDYDSRTGMHQVIIDTSDAFYATGNDFNVVITTGTVNSISVVGSVVAKFSIGRQNLSHINSIAASSVTTINANVGQTQPVNFTGTGASAYVKSDIIQAAGTAWASGAITAASIATDAIGADEIAAGAVTKIQTGLATPTNITAGTITTVTNLTNAPTNGDLTATMKASVNAEVDTALADIKLDHLVAVAESGDVVNSSIIAKLASKSATPAFSSFNNTTDSLEAIADNAGTGTMDANLVSIDGQLTNGNNATLKLKQLSIVDGTTGAVEIRTTNHSGFAAVSIENVMRGPALTINAQDVDAQGNAHGVDISSGANANGVKISGGLGTGLDILLVNGTHNLFSILTSALTTVGSIGKKLADWVLGTDNKILLSANAQTGVTIPTVTDVTNDVGITQAGADKVWAAGTRTLTSFGTLVADTATAVWAAAIRSLTDKAGFSISGTKQTLDALNDISSADVWGHIGRSLDTTVDANVVSINGEVSAAELLALSADTMATDEVNDDDFIPTTKEFEVATIVDADLSHYRDRWVIFTTGPLAKQARLIKNYNLGTGGKGHFVCDDFTQAPASTDRFIIV